MMFSEKFKSTEESVKNVGTGIYSSLPEWVRSIGDYSYDIASRYQILKDFAFAFGALFVFPLLLFISWSIGSLVTTVIIWAVAYAAINGFLIGGALLVLIPVFIITLVTAATITSITTICRGTVWTVRLGETFTRVRTSGNTSEEVFAENGDVFEESMYEEDMKQLECANTMKRLVFIDKLNRYFSRAKRVPGVVITEMIKLSPYHALVFICCVLLAKAW
ncbi:172_t:CDS:2 [Dentiscutata erythropus]|uniref:172_t:CDS:1 n=1 Tax=Dentiscutata erythropus TaxID=1348616 RepID=A0A9N9DSB9_9GLOM|nr:172_t:CDS:2 [Dentiscutata erythropus]